MLTIRVYMVSVSGLRRLCEVTPYMEATSACRTIALVYHVATSVLKIISFKKGSK